MGAFLTGLWHNTKPSLLAMSPSRAAFLAGAALRHTNPVTFICSLTGAGVPLAIADLYESQKSYAKLIRQASTSGVGSIEDLAILGTIAAISLPLRIFEEGTGQGASTTMLAHSSRPEAVIVTCDLPRDAVSKDGVRYKIAQVGSLIPPVYEPKIHHHLTPDNDTLRQLILDQREIDIAFLDGNHQSIHQFWVASEIWHRMAAGGILLIDDCTEGVEDFANLFGIKAKYCGYLAGFKRP